MLETDAHEWRKDLARNDISSVKGMISRYSEKIGLRIHPDTVDEQLLGRAFLKLLAENAEQTADHFRRDVYPYLHPEAGDVRLGPEQGANELASDVCPADIFPHMVPFEFDTTGVDGRIERRGGGDCASAPGPRAKVTFDEAWEDTVADLVANKRWDKGRAAHADSSRKLWLGFAGNAPLEEISKKRAIEFRRFLSRLPDRYHCESSWLGLPLTEVIEAADKIDSAGGDPIPRMSAKTVNRHISQLKRMWLEFEKLDHVSKDQPNPFDRLHIPLKKSRTQIREEHDQFTIDELRKLFSAPIWTGCRSETRRKEIGDLIIRDWKFWIPLIGAFSGMRREEICALKVGDIEQTSGIWIVNLRKAKMRLKTPGSPRYVPLHETLLRIGLIRDLVKGRASDHWLFPDLTPSALTDRRGEPFGKWFTPLRRDLGIYRPEVVFHSFRHTVSTMLHNAEAHHPFIEEIIGHESGELESELAPYTKETLVGKLKATIDKLDYGIDFSHLTDPRCEF